MSATLPQLILAVDALNSFVRSKSFNETWLFSGQQFKRCFYFYKRQALKAAHQDGRVWARGVNCGGTGLYVDMDGYKWPHCRACNSKGIVTLNFLETVITLENGTKLTWHSPEDHGRERLHGYPEDSSWGYRKPEIKTIPLL